MTRLVLILWCASACSDDTSECVIGDRSLDLELEIVYRTVDGRTADANVDGEIPLIQPPQGGKVALIGARVRNAGCVVQLTASLRDPCSNRIVALEQRPVTLVLREDGWGVPESPAELSNYANVPVCPSAAADRDLEREPYVATVRVEDGTSRTAEKQLTVTPVCAEPELETLCQCECDANYMLGEPCVEEADGGPLPGSCPDGGS